jgi:N-acetyl-alpha-D-glucosaminyl L-malate synthase BshA
MVEVIEYQNLDLLHVHYAIPHATSAYLAKQMLTDKNFKVVTTLHGTDITLLGSDPSYYKITKFSIEQSSGVTAVSNFLKAETQRVLKVANHIEVIPNFIPFSVTPIHNIEEIRARFASTDERIITHISNFRPLKRITDIVPIVKAVIKKHKVKVLMVGDGPERFKAEEQCRQENICDYVHFLGKQENVQDILAISDIMLLPSESESFGLAALEAMALGIPCVTSNAGGLPEVNIDKLTGFTLDVGDIGGYTDAINSILEDRDMARKMGKNAIEWSDSKYSPNIIIPKYLDYYEEILSA